VNTAAPEQSPTDGELVTRAAGGERAAFVAIYQRYHTGIYRFARSMTGSATMAEDVTQEVFLVLIRELKRYDPDRAALGTYLYAVARNVSRHRLRRERRFVQLDLPTAKEPRTTDDPSGPMMQSQAVARVRALIRGLSSRYREVLILCDLHGLSYEAAAAALDAPVGTVRSRLHRARQQLAERLAQVETHPTPFSGRAQKCLT
jgi:RNA polymerase sigma-70 factor (ECF subfamily)